MARERRRRTERVSVALEGRWLRRGQVSRAPVADVNAHGLFLRSVEAAPAGALMQLEVDLPTGTIALFVSARHVARGDGSRGTGAEIYLMGEGEKSAWMGYYRECLRALTELDADELELEEIFGSDGPL
jgi:hypothetical protein